MIMFETMMLQDQAWDSAVLFKQELDCSWRLIGMPNVPVAAARRLAGVGI